tara:strand:+ start:2477 stop:3484 length:1008 start_codon:yes stop_codon:yes gene_type:complete
MPANMKKAGIKYQKGGSKGGGIISRLFGKKKTSDLSKPYKKSERQKQQEAWVKSERSKMKIQADKTAATTAANKANKAKKRAENKSRKSRVADAKANKERIESSDRALSKKMNELKYDWRSSKDANVKKYIEDKMKSLGSAGPYKDKVKIFGKPNYKGQRRNEKTDHGSNKHWEMKSGGSVFNKQGMKVPGMQFGGIPKQPTGQVDPSKIPGSPQGRVPRPPIDPNKVPAPPVQDPRRGQTVPGQAPAPMHKAPPTQVDPNRIVNDIVNAGPQAGQQLPEGRVSMPSPNDAMLGNTTNQQMKSVPSMDARDRHAKLNPGNLRKQKGGATGPNGVL